MKKKRSSLASKSYEIGYRRPPKKHSSSPVKSLTPREVISTRSARSLET
jgi:hypothetical protein